MNTKKIKGVAATLCTALLFTGAVSCGNKDSGQTEGKASYGEGYPIQTDKTLDYWTDIPASQDYKSYRDQPFYKGLMERTGVDLNISFASAGQGTEAFNLLMASGDLPDLIAHPWTTVSGGPSKYISEKYIQPLNDPIEKYAPNLSKYLDEHPEIAKMIKTDEGDYYGFPFIRDDERLTTYRGPVTRKDWLDRLGAEPPETIDEWESLLRQYKEMGVESPLCAGTELLYFASAFGTWPEYYIQDGKVVYGRATKEYEAFLTRMRQWYAEGLIEADLGSIDANIINTKMTTGKGGIALGSGGLIGTWLSAGKAADPDYDLVALKWPVLNKGGKSEFAFKENVYNGFSAAISAACKDVELAARFLDYAYSEEGRYYYNFGIEGESYTMVDGYPTFTQAMYDYKSNDLGAGISRYIGSMTQNPCIQDYRMYEQRMQTQEQKDAIDLWAQTNMAEHLLPPVLPTSDESQEIANLNNAVLTYTDEMFFKFLLGKESLDNFDAYVDQLNQMGLPRVLELMQASYTRYQART